jgi:hypothetical protein
MELQSVESSMISAVGYDQESQTLHVVFNSGTLYSYFEVPPEIYAELMEADSKGSYMRNCVIDCYGYAKGKRRSRRR